MLHPVPPVQRFVLLHGFGRSYRRVRDACWRSPSAPRRRVQKAGHVDVEVDAPVDAVWDVVRDVTRVGEWSHECVGARWLGGATAAVAGARFRGRNRSGIFRWGRMCEIVEVGPREIAWRTVPTALYPDSSEWRIRVDEVDEVESEVEGGTGRTRIVQTFRVLKAPRFLDPDLRHVHPQAPGPDRGARRRPPAHRRVARTAGAAGTAGPAPQAPRITSAT